MLKVRGNAADFELNAGDVDVVCSVVELGSVDCSSQRRQEPDASSCCTLVRRTTDDGKIKRSPSVVVSEMPPEVSGVNVTVCSSQVSATATVNS
jgi:hypothetical protein